MSVLRYPLGRAALAVITACACLLSLLSVAQAGPTDNLPTMHKGHLRRAPYFGHLSGPAKAWVDGRCNLPLQSEFPPCISTFPTSN
jgi:hypothetical protein